ncbi:MAG: MarR family transcriptional regulator [Chloroflexota bacterium]|jgi:DNA-binding MarR family transcriptional regulator
MTHDINVLAQEILQIIPQIMRTLAAEFRQTGQLMTPGNLQLMFMLLDGPSSLSELAELHNVSLPTMSRTVSRLEKIGWIERRSDPHDRRVTLIVLTDDGQRRLMEMSDLAQETFRKALESTSASDRELLSAGLDVMRRTFDLYLYDTEKE